MSACTRRTERDPGMGILLCLSEIEVFLLSRTRFTDDTPPIASVHFEMHYYVSKYGTNTVINFFPPITEVFISFKT